MRENAGFAPILQLGVLIILLVAPDFLLAHDNPDELHFSHPLITESPSPDTKIRIDYFHKHFKNGATAAEHTPRVEFEYAFHPSFSLEANVPYTFRNVEGVSGIRHTDNIEVAVKLANFAFQKHHLLPVYGVSVELPTGSDSAEIGSGHLVVIEPYFGLGLKKEKLEIVGFSSVGLPVNRNSTDEDDTHLGYEFSFLFKPTPYVQPLIELNGETLLAGPESGQTIVNLSPGIKFRPSKSEHWQFGAGIGFPLTKAQEFKTRIVASAFYHF
jgi:hypothetical protein